MVKGSTLNNQDIYNSPSFKHSTQTRLDSPA